MAILQRDLYQQLRAESVVAHERLGDLVRRLDGAQLSEHPEPKGWSVAQVLEHLCRAHETTSAAATSVSRTARLDAAAPAREAGRMSAAVSRQAVSTAKRSARLERGEREARRFGGGA